MTVDKIRYEQLFGKGNFENERYVLEASLEPGESR